MTDPETFLQHAEAFYRAIHTVIGAAMIAQEYAGESEPLCYYIDQILQAGWQAEDAIEQLLSCEAPPNCQP